MHPPQEYVAILRCQTWNIWPEKTFAERNPFAIAYGANGVLPCRVSILSHLNRTAPERFLEEKTKNGLLVWDGRTTGLHRVRDTILKAPEDTIEVSLQHRNAHRGELDICINFRFDGDLPAALLDALRASAMAIMSLLNLQLKDFLTPSVPFQIRKVLPDGGGSMDSTVFIAVHSRQALSKAVVEETLSEISAVLLDSTHGEKLRVALELYAAHFNESQTRVRFLLLVIAIESLSFTTKKHTVATDLLDRWKSELESELRQYATDSEEYQNLFALGREMSFRAEDSIRMQVRKLFASIPTSEPAESKLLQQRAVRVYDRRSTLVHDGHLPNEELASLEQEARELLETAFTHAIRGTLNGPTIETPAGGV